MLSDAQLRSMRETETGSLPGVCRIRRAQGGTDPAGGSSITYAPDAETVACDVIPISQMEEPVGGRTSRVSDHIITLPYGTVLKSKDQIDLEDGSGTKLFRYEVVQPGQGDPYETAVEVTAFEIS